MSTRTGKHWIRAGAALASVAAVAAGTLVAAGSASAANRESAVSPAPYVWSDSDQYAVAAGLTVASDSETITVDLPTGTAADAFTEWSHPGYGTVSWRLGAGGTDVVSGSSAVDPATNSIEIALDRTVGSFGQPAVRLDLTAATPKAGDAYVPPALESSTTGFALAVTAALTVGAASGQEESEVDLSATTSTTTRHGGIFWAGGGSLTDSGPGDVVVVETGVPGFFGTSVKAVVGTDGSELSAPSTVLDDGSSVAVKPNQDFYDRYQDFSDTSLTGAPAIRITGAGTGLEQPAGSGVVVRVPLKLVAATTPTTPPTTPPTSGPEVTRLAGTDRQGTAVEISKATFPASGVPVVYIATGANFPDALAAGPAAAKQGGPLLLVDRDSMSDVVRAELTRLAPQRIVVVGSDLSVSNTLGRELAGYANGNIIRLGGTDRYDTARLIIQYAFGGGSGKAWLATGEKFPDALSAAAAAGKNKAPVILVNGGLPEADATTKAIVSRLRVSELTIAGSDLSVSAGIESSLAGPAITRIGGVDRYDTSEKLNRAAFSGAKTVFLATGENFPDALAGAAAAGHARSPLFAVQPTCIPSATLQDIRAGGATRVVLLGGTGTLSDAVAALTPCS